MQEKKNVLILDDDVEVGEVLGIILESKLNCTICSDSAKAKMLLTERSFAIFITDLEIPGTNTSELIKQVKSMFPQIKIMLSTGHNQNHPKVLTAIAAGAEAIIQKPFQDPGKIVKLTLGFFY